MSRRLIVAAAALVAAVVVLALVAMPPRPARVAVTRPDDPRVLAGALHVHTNRSDGSGTVDEVAAAAHDAGLQFVVFADHGDGRRIEAPAYRSGVLCVDGVEISTEDGHLVAVGLGPAPYRLAGEGRDVIADVHRLGGFAYVAHPTSPKPALAWHDWEAPFDGFEWLNADSEWRARSSGALARVLAGYFLRPAAALARSLVRPTDALERYDGLARSRMVVAIAGHDAHARMGPDREDGGVGDRIRLSLPSYGASFGSFASRVRLGAPPTGDARRDAASLLHAIRHGRVYTGIDGLAAPVRFAFEARSGGATAGAGERLIPEGPVNFAAEADAPPGATIVLVRNGRDLASGAPPRFVATAPPSAGEYRIEVRLDGSASAPAMPWISSNPIYVGVADTGGRQAPAAVREEPARFEPSRWRIEHEASSSGAVVAGEGGEMEFSYSLSSDPARSPYAAAVYDLKVPAGAVGIAFTASAWQPTRFSFQARAPENDPRGAGVRWRRSVFADGEVRRVAIPWSEMRRIGTSAARQPDVVAVSSVLVVADLVNTDAGGTGKLRLTDWRWLY